MTAMPSMPAETPAPSNALVRVEHLKVHFPILSGIFQTESGRVRAVDDIFEQPKMPYSWGLLDSLPRMDEEKGTRLRTIEGLPPDLINPGPECRFSPRCKYVHDQCRVEEPQLSERDGEGHLARCFGTEPGGWIK